MISLRKKEQLLKKTAEILHTEPELVPVTIEKFKREIEEAEDEIKRLKLTK